MAGRGGSPGRQSPVGGAEQTGGAGRAAPPCSLPHLPFSLKRFPATNTVKFKTNITVKPSCQPREQPGCNGVAEGIAPLAWRTWHPDRRDPFPARVSAPWGPCRVLRRVHLGMLEGSPPKKSRQPAWPNRPGRQMERQVQGLRFPGASAPPWPGSNPSPATFPSVLPASSLTSLSPFLYLFLFPEWPSLCLAPGWEQDVELVT